MKKIDLSLGLSTSTMLFIIISTFSLLGCKTQPPQKPLPTVTVAHPTEQKVVELDEYSGRLESPEIVNLAARVTGIIIDTPFEDGSLVKKDDVLFVIDDRPFKAVLASKEAGISKAEAVYTKSNLRLKRYQKIRETGAVSVDDLDQATADFQEAVSSLNAAKAAVEIAQLELGWTKVRAPISGRVSRKLVTVGNNIIGGTGNLTQLTTITSVDPLYAYISVPEDQFYKYNLTQGNKESADEDPQGPVCQYKIENDPEFKNDCVINFVDSMINVNTGTVQVRGVIPNQDSQLKPGMFVRVRLARGVAKDSILVPEIAIGADQDSRYLFSVDSEGIVATKPVELGFKVNELRVIKKGISLEDNIIIKGLQLVKPGVKVNISSSENPNFNSSTASQASTPVSK